MIGTKEKDRNDPRTEIRARKGNVLDAFNLFRETDSPQSGCRERLKDDKLAWNILIMTDSHFRGTKDEWRINRLLEVNGVEKM